MKTNTENSIRLAYAAPETTCLELLSESVMQTVSKFGNGTVNTQRFDVGDEEDDWM